MRKLKGSGAVLLGKTNMVEFGYGGNSAVSYFGAANNPWDLAFITGGSSSGSAAAVAARLCFGALGSDTGGSVRVPAAICGIVGLKPTYGLVSIRGVIPLSWSLDHVGPLTRTVTDNALMLQVIAGYDPAETTSVRCSSSQLHARAGKEDFRICAWEFHEISSSRISIPILMRPSRSLSLSCNKSLRVSGMLCCPRGRTSRSPYAAWSAQRRLMRITLNW